MDGAALWAEMRRLRPGIVALIVTAYPNNPKAGAALTEGAWKVVPKPVDFPALLALVDEALGQPLVLVVDDDHDLCRNLWDVLRDRGYRVCIAHDEAGAAERLRDGSYKVILLDMRLPDGDGASVFRRAKETNPQAEVVLITGHRPDAEPGIGRVLAEGARAVFHKPFDIPALLGMLESLTGKRSG